MTKKESSRACSFFRLRMWRDVRLEFCPLTLEPLRACEIQAGNQIESVEVPMSKASAVYSSEFGLYACGRPPAPRSFPESRAEAASSEQTVASGISIRTTLSRNGHATGLVASHCDIWGRGAAGAAVPVSTQRPASGGAAGSRAARNFGKNTKSKSMGRHTRYPG